MMAGGSGMWKRLAIGSWMETKRSMILPRRRTGYRLNTWFVPGRAAENRIGRWLA